MQSKACFGLPSDDGKQGASRRRHELVTNTTNKDCWDLGRAPLPRREGLGEGEINLRFKIVNCKLRIQYKHTNANALSAEIPHPRRNIRYNSSGRQICFGFVICYFEIVCNLVLVIWNFAYSLLLCAPYLVGRT